MKSILDLILSLRTAGGDEIQCCEVVDKHCGYHVSRFMMGKKNRLESTKASSILIIN